MTYRPAKKFTAMLAGISAVALVLTACSSSTTSSSSTQAAESSAADTAAAAELPTGDICAQIKALYPEDMTGKSISWYTAVGDEEKPTWDAGFKPFTDCTGATVAWEGSKEFEAQLKVRIASGNPPDMASIAQPGLIASLVNTTGTLKPADANVSAEVDKYFSPAFKGYGTVNDIFFAPPLDASVKSFVWYSPKAFTAAGYTVPKTYDELVALSDKIAAADPTGKIKPWCAGISSGDATGWPATDWLEDFMVRENGPDVYAQWVAHEIPFNDPQVAAALAKVGKFLKNPAYVNGGIGDVKTIASTIFQDGGVPITKGTCFMHRQASFYANFWPAGTTIAEDGDIFAFYLPTTNDNFGKPVLGAGAFAAVFADRPEVRALQYYVASPAFSTAYAAAGTNITANKELDSAVIKSPVSKLSYEILQDPQAEFVFDGSDLMPGEIGAGALWKQLTAWIATDQSDQVTLDNVEAAWPAS